MLESIIRNLINLKTEGSYWDFKQEWHSNNADLLHDIICMANNLDDCDAYIIIGVTNDGDVCGVTDINRKNQQNLIDFIKDIKFAGGIRPIIYVQGVYINNNDIDVIIIKNTANTPYFLDEPYKIGNIILHKGYIYTRIIDTNTPKNGNADIDKIEYLWKKRFGLIGNSENRLKRILLSKNWICEDKGEYQEHFYNENYPEIKIDINDTETEWQKEHCTAHDCFFYLYSNPLFWNMHEPERLTRKCYDIRWYGNRVRQFYTISAPKMYFDFVEPKSAFLNTNIGILLENSVGSGLGAAYAYFIEDSIEYLLFKVITPLQDNTKISNMFYGVKDVLCSDVIPVFDSEFEYNEFINYIFKNGERFKQDYNKMNDDGMFTGAQAKKDPRIKQSFRLGKLMVEWLDNWRNQFC